jgi:hypothetical protein
VHRACAAYFILQNMAIQFLKIYIIHDEKTNYQDFADLLSNVLDSFWVSGDIGKYTFGYRWYTVPKENYEKKVQAKEIPALLQSFPAVIFTDSDTGRALYKLEGNSINKYQIENTLTLISKLNPDGKGSYTLPTGEKFPSLPIDVGLGERNLCNDFPKICQVLDKIKNIFQGDAKKWIFTGVAAFAAYKSFDSNKQFGQIGFGVVAAVSLFVAFKAP